MTLSVSDPTWYLRRVSLFRRNFYHLNHDHDPLLVANGFEYLPVAQWCSLASTIHRDGNVFDAGCGNGMFLRFLLRVSPFDIQPWGCDFLAESIAMARAKILPAYADNLVVANVAEGPPFTGVEFTAIFLDPSHLHPDDIERTVYAYWETLHPDGTFVLYTYDVAANSEEFGSVEEHLPQVFAPALAVVTAWPVSIALLRGPMVR